MRAKYLFVCSVVAVVSAAAYGQKSSSNDSASVGTAEQNASTVSEDKQKSDMKAGETGLQTSDEEFSTRVRTMEEQVTDLKEKVFRTKARLLLLQESILGGGAVGQGSKAVLKHVNEMGSSFFLESAAYALDGSPIYTKADIEGDLDGRKEFEIFNGRIVPGQHQIAVKLEYRGHGYGVFSYLEDYRFRVQSSFTFDAEPGKITNVKVVAYEKGGITADLKDRPAVRYDLERTIDSAINSQDAKVSKN